MSDIQRKQKIAKERIAEQFKDVLKESGLLVVDCGEELGQAVVTDQTGYFHIQWLAPSQMVQLQGRIE